MAIQKPAKIARKLDMVYADVNVNDLYAHGSPRDLKLFELRCKLISALYTCEAVAEGVPQQRSKDHLDLAVHTHLAEGSEKRV